MSSIIEEVGRQQQRHWRTLLKEALIDGELSKLHLLESWRVGFIAAVITPFLFLLISSIFPFNDPVLVAFLTATAGSGAFLTSYYLKSIS